MKKLLIATTTFLFLALIAGSGALYFYLETLKKPFNVPNYSEFSIKNGDTAFGVLSDIPFFKDDKTSLIARIWLKLNKDKAQIKIGYYEFEKQETLVSFFAKLASGKQKQFNVTLIEGLNFVQWLKVLEQTPRVKIDITDEAQLYQMLIKIDDFCNNPKQKLEGCLLANTYAYTANERLSKIVERAYVQMREVLNKFWRNRFQDIAIDSPYKALILASVIEKETALAQERGVISGVFNNRLHKNMRLQTDPTVIYGVGASFDGDITRKHLRTPTPYNTYVIKGLPITPISMFGEASLLAATRPEMTDYIYFVSKGDGSHQFSETLAEHNRAVAQYQLNKGN